MKILWFKPILPYPASSGTRRVTLQVLKNLASQHEITLFTMLLSESEKKAVLDLEREVPGLKVVAPIAPNKSSQWRRLWYRLVTRWKAGRGIPPIQSYTCFPELVRQWRSLSLELQPDLAVIEYWFAMPYLQAAEAKTKVLFAHDIDFQVHERAGSLPRDSGRGGPWAELESAHEKKALLEAPHSWFLTEGDAEAARALGVSGASVIPYGLELSGELAPRRESDPPANPMEVLFFGSFHADFNRDGLRFVLEEVWPELRRLQPSAKLCVAGNGLPESLRVRCKDAGVDVLGEVDAVRDVYLSASVILIPLRYCGGLRIRLLEALALKCAVVGTRWGVLGMGPAHERELLAADSGPELAGQVARLLETPGERKRLGKAGRRYVEEHFSIQRAAEGQRALVRGLGVD